MLSYGNSILQIDLGEKKNFFTQVEKDMQILAMFHNSATVKSNISVFI